MRAIRALRKRCFERFSQINYLELGQLLWISALCFSYFGGEIRRSLSFLALFFLYKSKRRISWSEIVNGNRKLAIGIFCLFGLWVTFIPLFGAGGVKLGFRSMADPLEVIAYILGTLLFAQDKNFFDRMSKLMLVGAFIFFTTMLLNRYMLGFVWEPQHWILSRTAAHAGGYVCFFAPWIFLFICKMGTDRKWLFFLMVLLCESILLLVLSFYVTYWIAFISQFLVFLIFLIFKLKKTRIFLGFLIPLFAIILALVISVNYSTNGQIVPKIRSECAQIFSIGKSFEQFTSGRSIIWENTMKLISLHPITGWSWKNFHAVNVTYFEGQVPEAILRASVTPHSSYLSAAWSTGIPGLLLYLAVLFMLFGKSIRGVLRGSSCDVSFVVLILLIGYTVAGFAEDMFAWELRLMVPTWSIFALVLIPRNSVLGGPNRRDKTLISTHGHNSK